MASKIFNHSTNKTNDAKKGNPEADQVRVIDQWFNIHTMQYHPATIKFIEREAVLLKKWAENEESLRLCDFYDDRGYDTRTFYKWVAKFPEMEAAHEFAKRRIGSRRENGALSKKFDSNTVHRSLGYYDYVFAQEQEKAVAARLAVAEKSESKIVVIERFPSSFGNQDVEVISTSKLDPEKVAANIYRNTATDRQVRVNSNVGGYEEK